MTAGLLALVQARTSSRRLPGKVLKKAGGKRMLEYTLERLARCAEVSRVVVATSVAPDDDALAEFCERRGTAVFRGDLDDVAARLLAAAEACEAAAFIRINGDSPLIDPAIVDVAAATFSRADADLVTNVFPRSFPKGQSVEVVSCSALRTVMGASPDSEDREHVTRYFYRNPEQFTIRNFAFDRDVSALQLSVDSAEDFAAFEDLLARMTRPHWEYGLPELLALHEAATP